MNAAPRPNYLVHAGAWNPDSGGGIFLHMLVHQLRQLGEDAKIWPWYRDPRPGLLTMLRSAWRKPSLLLGSGHRFINPALDTPIAQFADLRPDTVVVYPEIRLGNPLGAQNVARWLLYKPGAQHPYRFGEGELFFRVEAMFDLPEVTGGAQDLVLWTRNPAYVAPPPDAPREGACYMVRKGDKTPRIPETADALCLDGKSHEEVAAAFARCRTFYSYDEATMFSLYAALCGCESVVVPASYASRAEWTAQHALFRHGVAYGVDDLPHARATQHLVEDLIAAKEAEGLESVKAFVTATQEHFG
ncbi:MAG: hypothetical protein KDE15_00440 [Erythrobacter sp.]|nr:hypothetical protein [Erythrobacter sp.]